MTLRITRIPRTDPNGSRCYVALDHARDLIAYQRTIDGIRRESWACGSYSADETAAALTDGKAPERLRAAFERERARWESKVVALGAVLPSRRRRLRHRDSGDVVDVGRYLSDRPDCWERLERGKSLPTVTLGVNYSRSVGTSEPQFIDSIAASVACAWALCEAGYPVRIASVWASSNYSMQGRADGGLPANWVAIHWTAKDWRDPLDVERLLVLGMPAVARVFSFGLLEKEFNAHSPLGYSHKVPEFVGADLGVDLFAGLSWIPCTDDGKQLAQALCLEGFEKR